MSAAVMLTGVPTYTAQAASSGAWADTGKNYIVNGDFEYISKEKVISVIGDGHTIDEAYGFDWGGNVYIFPADGTMLHSEYWQKLQSIPSFDASKFGWSGSGEDSTLVDGFGVNTFNIPGTTVQLNYDGKTNNAYAELNANVVAGVYQDLTTVPGSIYKWRLKHCSYSNIIDDSMSVMIGAPGKETASEAKRVSVNGAGDTLGSVGTIIKTHDTSDANYQAAVINQHDYSSSWETYEGTYIIPAGQTKTRFTFKAIDGIAERSGNNLDDIQFTISYPLSFDFNGGVGDAFNATDDNYAGYFMNGDNVKVASVDVSTPMRDGYTFLGWSESKVAAATDKASYDKAKAAVVSTTKMSSSGRKLYAVWAKNPRVTFVDGSGNTLKTQTVTIGTGATAPTNPTRSGYTFTGWDVSYDKVYTDTTVTAKWAKNLTVTFTDGFGKTLKTQEVSPGTDATAPANPSADGYTFAGWDKAFTNVTQNLTVNAKWTKDPVVTFVDGFGTTLKTQVVKKGNAATAPTNPTHSGYTFKGWDKTFNNITADTTVTAQWTKNPTVTFTDGFGKTLKTEVVQPGGSATAPSNPSKKGYVYKGWDKAFTNVTTDITVNAKWSANKIVVTVPTKIAYDKMNIGNVSTSDSFDVTVDGDFSGNVTVSSKAGALKNSSGSTLTSASSSGSTPLVFAGKGKKKDTISIKGLVKTASVYEGTVSYFVDFEKPE